MVLVILMNHCHVITNVQVPEIVRFYFLPLIQSFIKIRITGQSKVIKVSRVNTRHFKIYRRKSRARIEIEPKIISMTDTQNIELCKEQK